MANVPEQTDDDGMKSPEQAERSDARKTETAKESNEDESLLADFSLERLLDTKSSAKLDIKSQDSELHPDRYSFSELTPRLKTVSHKIEGEEIWKFVKSPSTDKRQILQRQKLLRIFIESGKIEEFIKLKNGIYGITAGTGKLMERYEISEYNRPPLLDAYREHNHGEHEVFQALADIEYGLKSMQELIAFLKSFNNPFLDKIAENLQKKYEELSIYTREKILDKSFAVENLDKPNNVSRRTGVNLAVFMEMARIAQTDKYAEATFDPTKKAEYKQGWNFLRRKEGGKKSRYSNEVDPPQVLNDSPKETQTTIYTGSNMSGKSFELRKVLFMQFVAQAYGYAPCAEGNFAIYDSFHYLDRASTNSGADLSAYGSEIVNLKDSIGRLGDHPFLCYDEGGSTTSAPDQYKLLTAVDLFLRQRHARIFFANHNEQFVVRNLEDQNVGLYHLETTVDEEGKAKYHHRLIEGPADSMALEVARSLKFPEHLLAHAKDYLEGRRTKVERVPKKHKKLRRYSKEEREELSAQKKDPQEVFKSDRIAFISYSPWANERIALEANKDGAFKAFSEDAQFRTSFFSGSPFCVEAMPEKTEDDADEVDLYEDRKRDHHGEEARLPFLLQFIKNCDNKDPREVLERQELFKRLTERGEYLKAVKLEELMHILIYRLRESLPKATDGLLAVNRAICPLSSDEHGSQWEHMKSRDIVQETLIYIELQKALFGADFPFDKEYEELKKLMELAEKAEAITMDIDIDALEKMENEDCLAHIKDPQTLEKIRKMLEVEKDRHNDLKKPITLFGLKKYISNTQWDFHSKKWTPEINAIHEELIAMTDHVPKELFGDSIKSFRKKFNEVRETVGDEKESTKWKGKITMRRLKDMEKMLYRKKGKIDKPEFTDTLKQIQHLIEKLEESLLALNLKPVGVERLNRRDIKQAVHKKMRDISMKVRQLPPKSIADFKDQKAIDLLMKLVDLQKKYFTNNDSDRGHLHRTLTALFADCDAIPEWLKLLRSYDNIHFDQIAGYMEKHLGELLEGVASSTGETLRGSIESGKDDTYSKFEGDMKSLEDALFRIKIKFPELLERDKQLKYAVIIDAELNDTRELQDDSSDDLNKFVNFIETADTYIHGRGQYKFSTYKRKAYEVPRTRGRNGELDKIKKEFIEKEIEGKLDRKRLSQIANEAKTLGAKAMEVVEGNGIRFSGEHVKATTNDIQRGDINSLQNIWRSRFKSIAIKGMDSTKKEKERSHGRDDMYPKDRYPLEWRELLYTHGIVRVSAIFLMGDVIKRQNHAPVDFHEGGEMRMKGAWSLFKPKEAQVASDVSFGEAESLKLFNGANMSGKTFFIKKLVTNVLWAMFTGRAPAKNARMPRFDEVIYLDRVQAKSDNNLSAFGNEIGFWNRFFEVLEQDANVMTVSGLDEIGSTTSPKYQSALTWAISLGLISKGSIAAIASHNHDAIDALKETYPGIAMPYHFATHKETDREGKTTFKMDYVLREGHVDSQAIDVAESMGLHPEIIRIARMIK